MREYEPGDRMKPPGGALRLIKPGILCLMILVFFAAFLSPIDYSGSDSQGTLLTAQALVKTGTLKLDPYFECTSVPSPKVLVEFSGKYRLIRGHCYYSFPVGSALASVPFVWLANLAGEDMVDAEADARLQNLISATLVAFTALLAFILSRCFAGETASLVLATAFVCGSPLISTMGTALWSSDFATVFVLLCLVLIARHVRRGSSLKPWLLGVLLAFAVLCRPTAGVFALVVLGLIFFRSARDGGRVLVSMGLAIVPFVVYSLLEFGRFLPDYYSPLKRLPQPTLMLVGLAGIVIIAVGGYRVVRRTSATMSRTRRLAERGAVVLLLVTVGLMVILVAGHDTLARRLLPLPLSLTISAVNGSLVSPSRGLLVFCPFFVVAGAVLALQYRAVRRDPLLRLAVAWFGLHCAGVARPLRWHGGHCYGPRVFTEAFPAVVILTLIAWEHLAERKTRRRRVALFAFLLASIVSIFMHTYQGLFNVWTLRWNSRPDIDVYQEDLFKWRYAQFLASRLRVERRLVDHRTAGLSTFPLGREVSMADGITAYFHDWSVQSAKSWGPSRRTLAKKSAVWFIPGRGVREVKGYSAITLQLVTGADSPLRVFVRVNGEDVELLTIDRRSAAWYTVGFPSILLKPNVPNEISFEVFPSDIPGSGILPNIRLWLKIGA